MDEKEFCLKLIRAVKRRPCLYNFNTAEYSCKDTTQRVWKELAKELDTDVNKCKEKWKNIKIVMKRHLRKGVIKRRKKYYLFDHLRFIIPYMGVGDPETYGGTITATDVEEDHKIEAVYTDPLSEEIENNDIETQLIEDVPTTPIENLNDPSLLDHTYNDDSLVQKQHGYHVPSHTEVNSRKKRSEEVHEMKKEYYVDLSSERKKQEEEAKKAFLMSLMPDLNVMDGQQTRYFKKCVMEIVEEILDGNMSMTFRTTKSSQKYC